MSERIRIIHFEDSPVVTAMVRAVLGKEEIDVVAHAGNLEDGINLAERSLELDPDAALVDRDLGSGNMPDSDGAKIIAVLRRVLEPSAKKFVVVEFSSNTEEGKGGIFVPSFGGDHAVLKDGKPQRLREVADLIKSPRR